MKVSPITHDGFQSIESSCPDRDQLHLYTGNLLKSVSLFSIPTVGPSLAFGLYHNSRDIGAASEVGIGWRHSAQARLERASSVATLVEYTDSSGRRADFEKVGSDWLLKDNSLFRNMTLSELGSGIWQLRHDPSGDILEFSELAGTPIVARLSRLLDQNDNEVEYVYNGSGELQQIVEPVSERALTLGWDSGLITSVSDPEGNGYLLSYTDDLLTELEMPDGCRIQLAYNGDQQVESRTDRVGFSTVYTYTDDRLTRVEGVFEAEVLSEASWEYPVDPVVESLGTSGGDFTQVLFTDARGKVWDFHFLANSMLWREINPLGHHRRFYYDDFQNLLYASEGYFRANIEGTPSGATEGPRDNFSSRFRFYAYDLVGNMRESWDANGLITTYTVDEHSRTTSVYRGQAHCTLGGDWRQHFCQDGYLFCAHGDGGTDWENLPDYVSQVTKGGDVDAVQLNLTEMGIVWSTQILEGVDPAESDRLSSLRRVGRWTSDTSSFTFEVELAEAKAFNLSLYTTSLDHNSSIPLYGAPSLEYAEQFGREVQLSVTDLRGTQVFTVTQNATGVWATFPVVGDQENPIEVEVSCRLSNQLPTISAIAFDPFEDRRVFLEYDGQGNLAKVIQPTSDPEREVSTEYSYNADGTVSEVVQALRESGVLSDSRSTSMFYQDLAKNLTRVEDALNGSGAPMQMEYNLNGDMVRAIDQDQVATNYFYDYRHRLIGTQNDLGHSTAMVYDGRGLLSSARDARGFVTEFLYTPQRRLWKIINALGEVIEYSYLADGLLESITDASGTVSFAYNDLGDRIGVTYPEVEVVLPDFSRQNLTPQLQMAYDVWHRLVAVTSPNGNLEEVDNINLVGALNLLRNGSAELESGTTNEVPMGWGEVGYTTTGPTVNRVRSSSDKVDGSYSFPLDIEPFDDLGTSKDWFQRRPGGGPGGRYLMSGWGKCAVASSLRLIAVVRDHAGALSEQKAATSMAANTWTSAQVRADMPGDAQVARTVPVLHQFRAGIDTPYGAPNTTGFLDDLKVNALSQLYQYDGENLDGTVGADGARVTLVRDRFGRVRQMVDPARRTVDFTYDVEDRLVLVRDSRGLTLSYQFDWLGNLVQFIDSRSQETTFIYDDLNRLLEIIQPDPAQNELFEYSPAGDLTSYTNLRGEERQFFYDAAHRLVRVDYLLTPVESIELSYDPNGNLVRLLERNGDQLRMSYDSLNRLLLSQRKSLAGPQWAFRNVYDAAGNRSGLTTNLPVYGTALYGTDAYLSGSDSYFTAAFNARRQMESLQDGLSHESSFGYNADGMLVEVDHPNGTPALKTRHRYDLVGKLLETQVLQDTDPLWKVAYGYNLAADRLSQHSLWPEGGNSYRYELDASGRLVRETINRFVLASVDQWASGDLRLTGFDDQATLRLISRDDSLAAQQLDLQRWDLAITDPVATQVLVKPGDGLHWVTSHGDTQRGGRVVSHILHHTSDNTAYDYPSQTFSVSDNIGWLAGRMLMRHRLPLEGEFDVRVSISEWQLFDCFIGLGVTRERYETSAPGNKYPPSTSGAINANGCDIVAGFDGGSDENRVIFNSYTLSDVTAQGLRLRRYLDGSTWMLEGFYHDGTTWVSHANWVDEFDGQTLYAYLHLSGKYGHVRWTDFVETEGAQFRVSSVSGTESVNQAAWPCYESQIYDAGQSVDWSKLSWTETLPSNTDVRLQLAVSDDPDGPWTYEGPSGVNTYYSTAAGHTLTSLTGRNCRFRAFLYSTDGADTPELSNVHLSHTGTSDSRMTTFEYDDAGNLLEIAITEDSGTTTETRTVNDLNQIDTATGGWEFLYDDNGCLIEKNNGTGVGDEKWEFSWNEDDRLIQVKKGVYAAGPVLVNEFTVDYTYDSMGRMLTRDDGTDVTTFVWDGWDLLSETTDSIVTDYLVPNGLIHSFLRDGDLYVCHVDALGSVRMVTDANGDVVAQFEYGAWGELLTGSFDSVPGGMPFGFVGGLGVRTDALTGLLYMRNRHYDCTLQRFISRDPMGLVGGINLYDYANSNPIKWVDVTGTVVQELQTGRRAIQLGRAAWTVQQASQGGRIGSAWGPWGTVAGIVAGLVAAWVFEKLSEAASGSGGAGRGTLPAPPILPRPNPNVPLPGGPNGPLPPPGDSGGGGGGSPCQNWFSQCQDCCTANTPPLPRPTNKPRGDCYGPKNPEDYPYITDCLDDCERARLICEFLILAKTIPQVQTVLVLLIGVEGWDPSPPCWPVAP